MNTTGPENINFYILKITFKEIFSTISI